jgi:tetratricopeptide (TPR) repeat protein
MLKMEPPRGIHAAVSALRDGVEYLRGGSLDRAWSSFVTAGRLSTDPALRSEALRRQGDVKRRRGEWEEALELVAQAVQIARDHALRDAAAAALNIEATIHHQRGDLGRAVSLYLEALREEPESHQRGLICQNLGTAYAERGDHEGAERWYAESSEAFGDAGSVREQLLAMNNQGSVKLDQGDAEGAETIFRDALRLVNTIPKGDAELQALVEMNLAEALARQRVKLEEAHDLMARAAGHFSASSNRPLRVACHRVLALVADAQGNEELALSALERGLVLAREVESTSEVRYFERELARQRGPHTFPDGSE